VTATNQPNSSGQATPKFKPHPINQFILRCLWKGELGDAQLLAQLTSKVFDNQRLKTLAYDMRAKSFYIFNGNHWVQDKTHTVRRKIATELPKAYREVASDLSICSEDEVIAYVKSVGRDQEDAKTVLSDLHKRACSLENNNRIRNVFNLCVDSLAVSGEEWDANPDLLGVKNGVIELKTKRFRPGRPDDYIKTAVPTAYPKTPPTHTPLILKHLKDMLNDPNDYENPELVDYVLRLLGSGLTGHSIDDTLTIFYGAEGRNGKDVLTNHLKFVLGGIAAPASEDVLKSKSRTATGQHEEHIHAMIGKRLVWFQETEKKQEISSKVIKLLLGGGVRSTRGSYGKQTEFTPQYTALLCTNYLPELDPEDQALWARIQLVTLLNRFLAEPDPKNPRERKIDTRFEEQLNADASATLWLLVEYAAEWHKVGLNPPKSVIEESKKYQKSLDKWAKFVEQYCEVGAGKEISAKPFREAGKWYAEINGFKYSKEAFAESMQKRFTRKEDNKGTRYLGVIVPAGKRKELEQAYKEMREEMNINVP
jgi:P4 family phage/plasmid primase-like protien